MKHQHRDMLTILAMILIAAASAGLTAYASSYALEWFGSAAILVLVCLFFLAYGFFALAYLKLLLHCMPPLPGTYRMDDFSCFLWKHQAMIRESAETALRPFFPLFLRGVYYTILGARLGNQLGIAGKIADPPYTTIGDHVMIGHDAYLTAHAIVYDTLVLEPIRVGAGATIGVHAVVMPGADIGDGAVIAPGAVVARGARVPAFEFWGGLPATRIKVLPRQRSNDTLTVTQPLWNSQPLPVPTETAYGSNHARAG